MRIFAICLLITGLAGVSKGFGFNNRPSTSPDSQESYVDDYNGFPEASEDDLPEMYQDEHEDIPSQDLDEDLQGHFEEEFQGSPPHDLDGSLPEDFQDDFQGPPPHDLDADLGEDFHGDFRGPPPHDLDADLEEDFQENFSEPPPHDLDEDLQEHFQDQFQGRRPDDLDGDLGEDFQDNFSEPPPYDLDEDSLETFKEALMEAFQIWNADVKACSGDVTCLARVNNVLRPMVNEATDNGVLSVIEPCEDRVGTYEVESSDGWIIEATLPC